MILLKWVIRPWLYLHYFFQKRTKTGTFGKDQAVHICNYLFRRFGYGEGGYVFIRLYPY